MLKDVIGVIGFIITVIVGALLINALLFRSYSVTGPSMEDTLHTNDRLIVNRLPLTFSRLTGETWVPARGEIVVIKNPLYIQGQPDKFLVKRVIGLPSERVVVKDGYIKIYNDDNPDGFDPDKNLDGPRYPTSGNVDIVVPDGEIFVVGDNRSGNASFDSRGGLGTIPLQNIQGEVFLRIYPVDKVRFF